MINGPKSMSDPILIKPETKLEDISKKESEIKTDIPETEKTKTENETKQELNGVSDIKVFINYLIYFILIF